VLDVHDAPGGPGIAHAWLGIVIGRFDHLVLTTRHREPCIDFYTHVLGMRLDTFDHGRVAFRFGDQTINLHEAGRGFEPKAEQPTPGGRDLCFLADVPLDAVIRRLEAVGIRIELGSVPRTGATGPIRSIYVRDPDGNLVEIAETVRTTLVVQPGA
jgi:catechol 2,3-dioxygenase-like lactoylglutathione lyase family enzyme